ncbi:methionine aminotransferase [Patiriisocius hiemis]|uniref:Methionine aminotransferase n=1 Tax=Patiriisocius hiemis TaxID=3075604 RepID=A0ABU2YE74_9FLAO|nr:methionine aminotransferase [Constantimarinum sp. W242]MDT0556486.1 methionine aminotransferase [Constantimarinum sp. W242]
MFKSKLPRVEQSIFSVMSSMANKHGAVNLSQGFPNFPVDKQLISLVSNAMKQGNNQYAPMAGDARLREVISHKIEKLYSRKFNPESEITITAGATQAIFTAISAVIREGDEVILFTPAYDCYEPAVQLMGGVAKKIQLKAPEYKPNWDEVKATITSKTKMTIINTPHNPSGVIFSESDMLQLQTIAEDYNLIVLSDEVYEHIIFDDLKHQSAARFSLLSQRTFITASFGKTFHTTGWKMGYCVAPEKLMKEFQKVHQYNVFCVNHPFQKALAIYLENENNYLRLPSFYQNKRDFFLKKIEGSKFKVIPSQGTYFQLLDFSEISKESDIQFAERLTKENKIATIPTSVFNKNKEDFKQIRVCFAKTEETLLKATAILNSI